MEKLNCLYLEDQTNCFVDLEFVCKQNPNIIRSVEHAKTVIEARSKLEEKKYDVLFADIQLKEGIVFEFLDSVMSSSSDIALIFVTAYDQFAIKAFEFEAIDYLLKPIEQKPFLRAIERARGRKIEINAINSVKNQMEALKLNKLLIPTMNTMEVVPFDKILYCKADSSYSEVITTEGTYLATRTLKTIQSKLFNGKFIRVHYSYLVNVDHLQRYLKGVGGQVVMANGDILPVSIRKKENLMKYLNQGNRNLLD
jgi:two-component system LytT family response regulator